MKTLTRRLILFSLLSLTFIALVSVISCEDYLPITDGTDPGGTEPGGTDPGGTNPAELDSISGLANKLAWLKTNALSGKSYVLVLTSNESIAPQALSFDSGRYNITVTLRGDGVNRTISLSSAGSMFSIDGSNTLVLDNNITFCGISGNSAPVVLVNGRFIMNAGSAITGNTVSGVRVGSGSFIMNGGVISGNGGGGVDVAGGSFTMSGGSISGNGSGGVDVAVGYFTMSGGSISGNTATYVGGGVNVGSNGSFTMSGGSISGNTADWGGGGVYVIGAVNTSRGSFSMSGGTISGNTARNSNGQYGGGGVCVFGGFFRKSGGTITGYASDQSNGNVVRDSSGAVQSNKGHAVYTSTKRKETTAGAGVNLLPNTNDGWDFY